MDVSLITAATLFLQAASEETGLDGWTRSREALVVDYRAACSGGVALACGAAERPLDLAAVKEEAIAGCAHRDAAACVIAAWAEAGGTLSGATATFVVPQLELGCTLGLPRACAEWVRWTARPKDKESASAANLARSRAACAAGDGLGCEMEAMLLWRSPAGDLAEAQERARAACSDGRAGACVVAARLAGPRPQGDADPHEAAACGLGVVSACLDLPVVPYEPAQILAWCHGGAVDACLRVRSDLPWIGMLLAGGAVWAMIAVDEGGDDARLAPYAEACRRKDLLACTVHGDVLVHLPVGRQERSERVSPRTMPAPRRSRPTRAPPPSECPRPTGGPGRREASSFWSGGRRSPPRSFLPESGGVWPGSR